MSWYRSSLLAAMFVAILGANPACAVEDTDTPGNGNWEINLEANGARSASGWEAPAVDVNYGWGDTVQLMAGLPWAAYAKPDVTRSRDSAPAR